MKRYQRKGFTLLELIIVIALFSIIMVSVVKLLDPVSKFFVRSSNFETTNACIDNMRRSIEGNLQYADRVMLCDGKTPYVYTEIGGVNRSDYKPSADLKARVKQFYNTYFSDRKFLDCIGKIYVLVFDNTQIATDTGLKKYQVLSDINANALNTGKIVRYEFEFDNYWSDDPEECLKLDDDEIVQTPWYVNQSLYGNFEYTFSLGAAASVLDAEGHKTFDPKDCTISITMNEIKKSPDGLVRDGELKTNSATFSMKNVLDASDYYNSYLDDYKIKERLSEYLSGSIGILDLFERDATPHPRFDREDIDESTDTFKGFYFIYTMPETTYDLMVKEGSTDSRYMEPLNRAKDYLQAVKDKYNT